VRHLSGDGFKNMRTLAAGMLAFVLLFSGAANAHRPYFRVYSDWIKVGADEYQVQGWYGDGIFIGDPVRVILRHRNGGMAAWTDFFMQASAFCPSLDFCWGFTYGPLGLFPDIWRLDPSAIKRPEAVADPEDGYSLGYPTDLKSEPQGFTSSSNVLMYPVAWGRYLSQPAAFGGIILATPVVIFWLLRRWAKNFSIRFLLSICVFLSSSFLILITFLYGLGISIFVPFIVAAGIKRLIPLVKARLKPA